MPQRVHAITGTGAEYSLNCSPDKNVIADALAALGADGVCEVIGDPGTGIEVSFEVAPLIGLGKTLHGTNGGDAVPRTFLPHLIDAHQRGMFPFEKIQAPLPLRRAQHRARGRRIWRRHQAVLLM